MERKKSFLKNLLKELTTTAPPVVNQVRKPKKEVVEFKVVGIAYDNENGKNRQDIIKSAVDQYFKDEDNVKYDGLTNKEIKECYCDGDKVFETQGCEYRGEIKIGSYKNKPTIEVYMFDNFKGTKKQLIGFAAKGIVSELVPKMPVSEDVYVAVTILVEGGTFKQLSYDEIFQDSFNYRATVVWT